jgi:hypothetical protein
MSPSRSGRRIAAEVATATEDMIRGRVPYMQTAEWFRLLRAIRALPETGVKA